MGVDLTSGVRQAMSHLINVDCRRIAFASQESSIKRKELRALAYTEVMQKNRIPAKFIALSTTTRATSRAELKSYIDKHGCPDGILCFNDVVALGIYRALCELGIKVPQQVALVGCDGIEDTEYLECPITTIVQPVEEMCRLAWDILQERIKNPRKQLTQKVLLSQLAVRDSSLYFGGKVK